MTPARQGRHFARACALGALIVCVALGVTCASAAQTVRVVAVADGDTLTVDVSGKREKVRLIGVDTPELGTRSGEVERFAREAKAFTESLVADATVRLEDDPDNTDRDRYDRLLRYVFLPDGRLLNAAIIEGGYGHAYTRYPFGRLAEFRGLEREAREAGRGLWNPELVREISSDAAGKYIGDVATVCGRVASTRYLADAAGSPTFLNLGKAHPDQDVTIVIWGNDRRIFGRPEDAFRDKAICVTGKIRPYRGDPQINVHDPTQIAVR